MTIPASVEVGNTATVSASGVNVASGSTLTVTIDSSTSFVMENDEHATLTYEIHKGSTTGEKVNAGGTVLDVSGGTANASKSATLAFVLAPDQVEKFSGTYIGTVKFRISLDTP